jgi:hypothetical protein
MRTDRDTEETDTFHYYKWGNKPVIYDDKHTAAFQYMNGKWSVISKHTFDDHADEIVDDNELQRLFPESIKKEYNKYITERYNQGGTNVGGNITDCFCNL